MLPPLDHPSFREVARALARFDPLATAAVAGGLLTVPAYTTACIRLEALANLALLHCRGARRPQPTDLRTWVDDLLGTHDIARLEDPLEDIFVSAVAAPDGVYRTFEGTWERNDSHRQDAIDALPALPAGPERQRLMREARALLVLSEEVCKRRGLERWIEPEEALPRRVVLGHRLLPKGGAEAVTFTVQQLAALGIALEDVAPFVTGAQPRARDEGGLNGWAGVPEVGPERSATFQRSGLVPWFGPLRLSFSWCRGSCLG